MEFLFSVGEVVRIKAAKIQAEIVTRKRESLSPFYFFPENYYTIRWTKKNYSEKKIEIRNTFMESDLEKMSS